MQIIFPITPLSKPRMTKRDKWLSNPNYKAKKQSDINRQQMLFSYWNYKDSLVLLAQEHDYRISNVLENITFVLPMPQSYSNKKKKELEGKSHDKKPDLDNLIKAFQDCLCESDSHIYKYNNVQKIWGSKGKIIIEILDKKQDIS